MSSPAPTLILARVFSGRSEWFIAAAAELYAHGAVESLGELRMVQVRAGLHEVALHGPELSAEIAAAVACHAGEWREASSAEVEQLALFFAKVAKENAKSRISVYPEGAQK